MSNAQAPASEKGQGHQEVFIPESYHFHLRGRAIKSCLECRRRKMRCSRSQPCQNCNRFRRKCIYLPLPDWPAAHSPESVTQESRPSGRWDTTFEDTVFPTYAHSDPDWHGSRVRRGFALDTDYGAKQDGIYSVDADNESPDRILQIAQNNDSFLPRNQLPANAVTASQHYANLQSASIDVSRGYSFEPPNGLLLSALQSPNKGWEDYVPSQDEGKVLYYQYLAAVDPLAHILHKPFFALHYHRFTSLSANVQAIPPSFKALLLATFFAAAVSLAPMQSEKQLGIQQQLLVAKLKAATEKALIDANYMSSIKLQTLQAFTIYLIPQCREEVSRSHTILIGALVRLGECAGLHRGASDLGMSPSEKQVRRLLWHEICFLDIRAAESQGPQPTIREDEADNPLPSNTNDSELDDPSQTLSNSRWTDATFSLIRYECYAVHRLVLRQRVAIDNKTIDLASVRHEVNRRKRTIKEKYLRHLDEHVPIQRCAKLVGRVLTARFDALLLQRHLQDANQRSEVEHELQHTLIKRGLETCESAAALETAPDLAPWAWYAGAYQQYHQAITLLTEVYRNPYVAYADRINAILDFVFGRAPGLTTIERNRDILRLLAEQFSLYTQLRGVKTVDVPPEQRQRLSPNKTTSTTATANANTSNMARVAPSPQPVEDYQALYDWQPAMNFEMNPMPYFAAPDMSDWENISTYQSGSENSVGGESWPLQFQQLPGGF